MKSGVDIWREKSGYGIVEEEVVEEATTPEARIEAVRNIVKKGQATKIDGVTVDSFTASGIVQVYDGLSDKYKEEFAAIKMPKMASLTWKLIKKLQGK